ncbi:MAG: NIPSNAP family protein [Acidobacteria bacterium]|nr:NIPSNAP family protein [Acidobacteriota bacterium]
MTAETVPSAIAAPRIACEQALSTARQDAEKAYKDSNERTRIREESRKDGQWPPQSGVRPTRQENKLLIPASFSPLR